MQFPLVLFCVGFVLSGSSLGVRKLRFRRQTLYHYLTKPGVPNMVMLSLINIPSFGGKKIKSFVTKDTQPGVGQNTSIMAGGVGYDFVKAIVQSELGKGINVKYTVEYESY